MQNFFCLLITNSFQYTVLILLGFMMEAFIGLMSYVYQVFNDTKKSQHFMMSSGPGDQGLGRAGGPRLHPGVPLRPPAPGRGGRGAAGAPLLRAAYLFRVAGLCLGAQLPRLPGPGLVLQDPEPRVRGERPPQQHSLHRLRSQASGHQ